MQPKWNLILNITYFSIQPVSRPTRIQPQAEKPEVKKVRVWSRRGIEGATLDNKLSHVNSPGPMSPNTNNIMQIICLKNTNPNKVVSE